MLDNNVINNVPYWNTIDETLELIFTDIGEEGLAGERKPGEKRRQEEGWSEATAGRRSWRRSWQRAASRDRLPCL